MGRVFMTFALMPLLCLRRCSRNLSSTSSGTNSFAKFWASKSHEVQNHVKTRRKAKSSDEKPRGEGLQKPPASGGDQGEASLEDRLFPERKKSREETKRAKTQRKKIKSERKLEHFMSQDRNDVDKQNWNPAEAQSDLRNEERLAKVLSRCGVASRRNAEKLIADGSVTVNRQTVVDVARKINPFVDMIAVRGKPVELLGYTTWIMLHKPVNIVSTVRDERNRKTVVDLIDFDGPQLVPVGRLDRDTTGLLLLTNDYSWVNRLTHPRYQHWKEYLLMVQGHVKKDTAELLRSGLMLPGEEDGRMTAPAEVKILEHTVQKSEPVTQMVLRIREGRNRQIRRMMMAFENWQFKSINFI